MQDLLTLVGPAVTIIAAAAAVTVTYRLGKEQQRIAKEQARTALDQLRYNLFQKRYAIYEAAGKAISIGLDRRDEDKRPDELNELFRQFEEARFFFPEYIYQFLYDLRNDLLTFLAKNNDHRKRMAQNIGSSSVDLCKLMLDEANELLQLQEALYVKRQNLPKTFEQTLAFPQLTGRFLC